MGEDLNGDGLARGEPRRGPFRRLLGRRGEGHRDGWDAVGLGDPADLDRVEPRPPLGERGPRNVPDAFEKPDQPVVAIGRRRCEPDAAVADRDRRHPVQRRRSHLGVPRDLAVEVRVQIDEPRRHDQAGGVDLDVAGGAVDRSALADLGNAVAGDGHVASGGWRTGAVDHQRTANDRSCHRHPRFE